MIEKTYAEERDRLKKLILSLPWEDGDFYKNWLAQTAYFVTHSVPLLKESVKGFTKKQADTKARFEAHIKEENNHELIAMRDLTQLGTDISNFKESHQTKAMYHSQYFRVHENAMSLMGYIILLEGVSVDVYPLVYERIKDQYPPESTKFLKLHVEEDPDHLEKAFKQCEGLGQVELELINDNISFTGLAYGELLNQCVSEKTSNYMGVNESFDIVM